MRNIFRKSDKQKEIVNRKEMNIVKNKGITLIALIITIILLLILAGVILNLILKERGIFNIAKKAGENYINAQDKELNELDKLYSSLLVADDSKVTLTMQELDEYINRKLEEKLSDNGSVTGINNNAYICNKTFNTGISEVTSMNGLEIGKDENDNISKYLSYSNTDGYTVLKSGWYFIQLEAFIRSEMADSFNGKFLVNNIERGGVECWENAGRLRSIT